MIQKIIQLKVVPGGMDSFMAKQQIWNEEMAQQPGFACVDVRSEIEHQNWVTIVVEFDSKASLDQFMATPHDQLEETTQISKLIEEISVQVIDDQD